MAAACIVRSALSLFALLSFSEAFPDALGWFLGLFLLSLFDGIGPSFITSSNEILPSTCVSDVELLVLDTRVHDLLVAASQHVVVRIDP